MPRERDGLNGAHHGGGFLTHSYSDAPANYGHRLAGDLVAEFTFGVRPMPPD